MKYQTHNVDRKDLELITSYFKKVNGETRPSSLNNAPKRSGLSAEAGINFVIKMPKKRALAQG